MSSVKAGLILLRINICLTSWLPARYENTLTVFTDPDDLQKPKEDMTFNLCAE